MPKDDPRFEVLGQFDELQAVLACALAETRDRGLRDGLGSAIAETARALEAIAGYPSARPFPAEALERLEKGCDALRELAPSGFVLPGGDPGSTRLNLCRTVARRAERSLVAAFRVMIIPPELSAWCNRLSEWLFLASLGAGKEDREIAP